jgi:uncharacterized membrane protein YphA (DoxX/SURF4 family)
MAESRDRDSQFWWRTQPLTNIMLLGARLYAGITIASAGFDKLPTPDWMVDQVIRLKVFPAPHVFAFAACFTEFVGGILLACGLFTRSSAFFLTFTMGVAAFGFHKVLPIVDMHIAQGFVWLFVVFLAIGPGKLSLDYCLRPTRFDDDPRRKVLLRVKWFAALVLLATIGLGLYRQFVFQRPVAEPTVVRSIQVAGSFNDWSLTANPLEQASENLWFTEFDLSQPGFIEFKFAVDGSWQTNYGALSDDAQTLPIENAAKSNGQNIVVQIPVPGRYRVEVDLQDVKYSVRASDDGSQ